MKNETSKVPPLAPPVAGGNPPARNNGEIPVAPKLATGAAGNPAPAQSVSVPAAPTRSAKLFGGHVGGGKKRTDCLIAGSKEAIEVDRKKDVERKRRERAEKRAAETPPPLSRPNAPAQSAVAAEPVAELPLRVPTPAEFSTAIPVGNFAPMFVAWAQNKLQKPAALLTKILARSREFLRTKQIKKLNLTAEREKKIIAACKWREDVVNDFSQALAECATVELNRRQVPGAEHSHYITLAMSAGELVYQEIETSRLIESLVLEDRAEKLKETGGKT